MTIKKALREARKILGDKACVQKYPGLRGQCMVGILRPMPLIGGIVECKAQGDTWEEALSKLAVDPDEKYQHLSFWSEAADLGSFFFEEYFQHIVMQLPRCGKVG